ncbi:Crp/Fnr family transcriptional regulator [Ulvibacterium sp.]|uniref:Crp/Fnr family transcriptional regulator n=1 Tax=Ulvibacterium sp. TaxID=2665914 RepID=UPI00260D7E63|nr:Crp/Fnr family transcriptional regulator [Ulvibacterium sp.]
MIRTNNELLDFFSQWDDRKEYETFRERQFVPGQKLIVQGKKGRLVHIIKEGIAKCYVSEENGKEFVQEFFGAGELLGEIEVLNNTRTFGSVMALTDVTTYCIGKDNFCAMMNNIPGFNLMVSRALATKLRDTAIRTSRQQTYSTAHNLNKLSPLFSEETGMFSKKDIADYLGITLRSLNRALKEMEQMDFQKEYK